MPYEVKENSKQIYGTGFINTNFVDYLYNSNKIKNIFNKDGTIKNNVLIKYDNNTENFNFEAYDNYSISIYLNKFNEDNLFLPHQYEVIYIGYNKNKLNSLFLSFLEAITNNNKYKIIDILTCKNKNKTKDILKIFFKQITKNN